MPAFQTMSVALVIALFSSAAVSQGLRPAGERPSQNPANRVVLSYLNAHLEPKDAVMALFDGLTGGTARWLPPSVPPSPDATRLFLVPTGDAAGGGMKPTSEAYCVARQRLQKTKDATDPTAREYVRPFLALPLCIEVPTARLLLQNIQASFDRAEKEFYLKRSYALEAEIKALTL